MGEKEIQTMAQEEKGVDRTVEEIEWEGELPFTEAEMLDGICDIITKDKIPIYTGKGAFTVSEVRKRNEEKGFVCCETTTRDDLNLQAEEGKLIKVKVRRSDSTGKLYWPVGYVKPEIYAFYAHKED